MRLTAIALLGVLLLSGMAAAQPAHVPQVSVDRCLGVAHNPPLGDDLDSRRRLEQDLDAIAAGGFRVLRADFLWRRIEPKRGTWDFVAYDRLVDAAARRGIEVLALLCYGNPWASRLGFLGDECFPPQDRSDFARYVEATARHFRGRVRRYEIWNEPNAGPRFWKPFTNARGYAALLDAAYRAGKAADPLARFAFGGLFWQEFTPLVPGALHFAGDVFRARPGMAARFDAFAFHPYRYPFVAPEDDGLPFFPDQEPLTGTVERTRGFLSARQAGGKALWITEAGWHTAPWSLPFVGVSEDDQARYLVRGIVLALARGVELFVTFTLRDGPLNQQWQEDAFGLLAYDPDPLDAQPARPKRAYGAHRVLADALALTHYDADLAATFGLGRTLRAYRFAGPAGRVVWVLWSTDRRTQALSLPLGLTARTIAITDLDGRPRPVRIQGSGSARTLAVDLSPDPIYVELR